MGLSPYFAAKDLAQLVGVHPRTVKRKAKEFNVPPTIADRSMLRWSFKDASRLLRAWENHKLP